MALVVLVLRDGGKQVSLGAGSISALAALGVTSVALVGDEETMALVLEGWAFASERAQEAAAALGAGSVATLTTLVQMGVSAADPLAGPGVTPSSR